MAGFATVSGIEFVMSLLIEATSRHVLMLRENKKCAARSIRFKTADPATFTRTADFSRDPEIKGRVEFFQIWQRLGLPGDLARTLDDQLAVGLFACLDGELCQQINTRAV